jgi:hypothetical protein
MHTPFTNKNKTMTMWAHASLVKYLPFVVLKDFLHTTIHKCQMLVVPETIKSNKTAINKVCRCVSKMIKLAVCKMAQFRCRGTGTMVLLSWSISLQQYHGKIARLWMNNSNFTTNGHLSINFIKWTCCTKPNHNLSNSDEIQKNTSSTYMQ